MSFRSPAAFGLLVCLLAGARSLAQPASDGPILDVTGRVTDVDGRAVAGAEVAWVRQRNEPASGPRGASAATTASAPAMTAASAASSVASPCT